MSDDVLITCPKCNTVLDRLTHRDVEVDLCSSCGGIWLDQGELAKLKLGDKYDELKALKPEAETEAPPSSEHVTLSCPTCEGDLQAFPVQDVLVDICQGCKGLWLDKGELDIALEALDSEADPEVVDALMGVVSEKRSS